MYAKEALANLRLKGGEPVNCMRILSLIRNVGDAEGREDCVLQRSYLERWILKRIKIDVPLRLMGHSGVHVNNVKMLSFRMWLSDERVYRVL